MPRYKRTRDEAELDLPALAPAVPEEKQEMLSQLRNMWEFASLMQYIFMFGSVVKINDDFDIEDLEQECLAPQPSVKLASMGLAMLKYVSSHRGLTPEIFDEYTRRQYTAKAPSRNPYGEDDEPAKFDEFDVFTKIRVLQQLSTWTFGNADRIRCMMPDDEDQVSWRMEPLGWDKEDRVYFVLDDNRMYRRTDEQPPPPSPKPISKSKSKKSTKKPKARGTRMSKRRKIEEEQEEEEEEEEELDDEPDAQAGAQEDITMTNGDGPATDGEPAYGFTDKTWECIAITLEEYNDFLATIFRTRDPNEKQLRKRIEEDVLPVIEKRAEALKQKQLKKLRELENVEKMATAKRSSRLAGKAEQQAKEREIQEAEEKKQAELRMVQEEQERQKRIEEGHESRRLTREQRLKEREVKRILHEEELARIEEEASRPESLEPVGESAQDAAKRISKRQLKTQKEQHQKELEKLGQDLDSWYFDCSVCGMHGENLDDGTHSIACDKCEVWQHSKCHGYSPKQAESDVFKFICATCKRKAEDANKPKIPTLKLGKSRQSASPESQKKSTSRPSTAHRAAPAPAAPLPDHVQRQLDGVPSSEPPRASPGPFGNITNAPSFPPQAQQQRPPSGYGSPPVGNFASNPTQPSHPRYGSSPPNSRPTSGYAGSPPPPMTNGYVPHYQQHQQMHHTAVSNAGGHPAYQAAYPPQPVYGQSPGAPIGGYQAGHPQYQYQPQQAQHAPQAQYYPGYQHPQYQAAPPPQAQYQQQQRRGSTQLMNGLHSPMQHPAQPAASPAAHARSPYAHGPGHAPAPPPTQNGHSNFPPPANGYAQQAASSPIKPSPAQQNAQVWYPPQRQPHQSPPQLTHTPQQSFRPPSANGHAPNLQTPQHHTNPSPAGANANVVAADGMSGPWPENIKVIPQKHDQSPAPPGPPIQPRSETKFTPPVALAPSPGQAAQAQATGPQSVPVKKAVPAASEAMNGASVAVMEGNGVVPNSAQKMAPSPTGGLGSGPLPPQ